MAMYVAGATGRILHNNTYLFLDSVKAYHKWNPLISICAQNVCMLLLITLMFLKVIWWSLSVT
jgi:hypothetical protein